jgi:capsular polysaccharide biosynthesis protein
MDFKEYLAIIKKRLWLIIACVVISTATTTVFSNMNYVPMYQASTKLIVNKTVEQDLLGREQMDLGAIGINMTLINTYTEIIKTPAIMNKVVEWYPDLNMKAEQLIDRVHVSSLNGTQVMTLSTVDFSYERAARTVNAVTEVFQSEIPKIMKVDNVAVLHMAPMEDQPMPINQRTNQTLIISFAVSLMIAVGIAFLLEFMDDTLRKESDIRQIFDAPVLAIVPLMSKAQVQEEVQLQSRSRTGEVANVHAK